MSDRTPETQDNLSEASQNDAIDQSRRKLTGAALGVSAVFTLASRPVWANQCSISGMASGNLSAPKVACEGCTPGYWKECQHLREWGPAGFSPTDTFNSVFGVTQYVDCKGTPYTLLDVMYLNGGSYVCSLDTTTNTTTTNTTTNNNTNNNGNNNGNNKDGNNNGNNKDANPGGAPAGCTHGTAFGNLGGDPISENLGFHAVAALLSAAHPRVNYGYTSGEIIDLFRNNLHRAAELKNTLDMLNKRGCPL